MVCCLDLGGKSKATWFRKGTRPREWDEWRAFKPKALASAFESNAQFDFDSLGKRGGDVFGDGVAQHVGVPRGSDKKADPQNEDRLPGR